MKGHYDSQRLSQSEVAALVAAAADSAGIAYARYSKFPVGAAVMRDDRTIHAAGNIENASFGLTLCAERAAIVKALESGQCSLLAVAVACAKPVESHGLQALVPCGACRQWMAEFSGPDLEVFICGPTAQLSPLLTLEQLLPAAFRLPEVVEAQ